MGEKSGTVSGLFDSQLSAIDTVVNAFESDFELLEKSWSAIETKAQGTIAVAGIFVGFTFSYLKENEAASGFLMRGFALCVVLCLLASVATAVYALFVTRHAGAPEATLKHQLAEDYFGLPATQRGPYHLLLAQNLVMHWSYVTGERRKSNDRKARRLLVSQSFLSAAIVLTAILAAIVTFHPPHPAGGPNAEVHQTGVSK